MKCKAKTLQNIHRRIYDIFRSIDNLSYSIKFSLGEQNYYYNYSINGFVNLKAELICC